MPFQWGEHDCALFVADWVLIVTGRDGAAHLRGQYETERQADQFHGVLGLVGTVRKCAKMIGLRRTLMPGVGDIAVIRGEHKAECAIRAANGWFVRGDRKILKITDRDARLIAAWEVACRRP